MKNIAERWTTFEARAIRPDAPSIQRGEMQIAFYAGAKAMLDATVEISVLPDLLAILALEAFHIELREFVSNREKH